MSPVPGAGHGHPACLTIPDDHHARTAEAALPKPHCRGGADLKENSLGRKMGTELPAGRAKPLQQPPWSTALLTGGEGMQNAQRAGFYQVCALVSL